MSANLDQLSFVSRRHAGGGFDYWSGVAAGQSYSDDCETGERLAEEFITFCGEHPAYGNTTLLGPIMLAMEENGATKGHKVGFINTVNQYAIIGGAFRSSILRLLDAQDRVGEAINFTRLVANAIDGMLLDDDMKAFAAGVYEIEKRLCQAQDLLKGTRDSLSKHWAQMLFKLLSRNAQGLSQKAIFLAKPLI